MPEKDQILEYVRTRGVIKARDLTAQGFHSQEITRLVESGQLDRLARGLYALPHHDLTPWHDLAEISKTIPGAIVNLISALAYHQIGTQLPYQTWISLPAGAWTPRRNPRLRVTHLSEPYYSTGVEEHEIEGVNVKIYNPAKTVADCFRMRSKAGYDVAVEALREGWRAHKFTADELIQYARTDRVERVMKPYIEALIS